MMMRRRPLLRAAVVGGGAYMAGKRHAERQDAESGYGAADSEPASPPQTASAPAEPSVSDQLAQLSNLHAQGALSDAEFASAKAKLLGS